MVTVWDMVCRENMFETQRTFGSRLQWSSQEVVKSRTSIVKMKGEKTASRDIFRSRIKTIVSFYILECYVKTRRYLICY